MGAPAQLKYHYFYRFFTYSVERRVGSFAIPCFWCEAPDLVLRGRARSALKTVSGGEFDWGGTSVKR